MAAKYSIDCIDSVIEVRVTGTPDRTSIAQMWKDIVIACKDHHCLSILGLSNMEQPIKLADAIDHQAISYFAAPKKKEGPKSLDEVDPELLATYEKLGISLSEQKRLSNVAVDAVFAEQRGDERALCEALYMSWDQARALRDAGGLASSQGVTARRFR